MSYDLDMSPERETFIASILKDLPRVPERAPFVFVSCQPTFWTWVLYEMDPDIPFGRDSESLIASIRFASVPRASVLDASYDLSPMSCMWAVADMEGVDVAAAEEDVTRGVEEESVANAAAGKIEIDRISAQRLHINKYIWRYILVNNQIHDFPEIIFLPFI